MQDEQPAKKKKRNRVQKQCYSLKAKIETTEVLVAELTENFTRLSREHQRLHDLNSTIQLGLTCANEELAHAFAARCALGRTAAQLARDTLLSSLSELPTPSQWTPTLAAAAARFSSEQIRYVTLRSYERAGQLVAAGANLEELGRHVAKTVCFIGVQTRRNPERWALVRGCHLLRGPGEVAPEGWYAKVASGIPSYLFPDNLLANLHKGLAEYDAAVAAIHQRREELRTELQRLLPCDTAAQASPSQGASPDASGASDTVPSTSGCNSWGSQATGQALSLTHATDAGAALSLSPTRGAALSVPHFSHASLAAPDLPSTSGTALSLAQLTGCTGRSQFGGSGLNAHTWAVQAPSNYHHQRMMPAASFGSGASPSHPSCAGDAAVAPLIVGGIALAERESDALRAEEVLRELSELFQREIDAAHLVYQHGWQGPAHALIAFLAAACLPYQLDVPAVSRAVHDRLSQMRGVGGAGSLGKQGQAQGSKGRTGSTKAADHSRFSAWGASQSKAPRSGVQICELP